MNHNESTPLCAHTDWLIPDHEVRCTRAAVAFFQTRNQHAIALCEDHTALHFHRAIEEEDARGLRIEIISALDVIGYQLGTECGERVHLDDRIATVAQYEGLDEAGLGVDHSAGTAFTAGYASVLERRLAEWYDRNHPMSTGW